MWPLWGVEGVFRKEDFPPVRLMRAAKKNYFLADSAFTECSRLIARLLSLSRGRQLKSLSVNSAWAMVGQNSLAFCRKGGRAGAGGGLNQTTRELRVRADFCTSGMSTPSHPRTRPSAQGGCWLARLVPSLPDQKGYCAPRAATSRGPWTLKGTAGANVLE